MVDIRNLGFASERDLVEDKQMRNRDEMPWYHREMFKNARRLDVPLTHSRQLRQVAQILRVLANRLETASSYTEVPESTILYEASAALFNAREELKALNATKKSGDNVKPLRKLDKQ